MNAQNTNGTEAKPPLVVGTVHSAASLQALSVLAAGTVDLVELRVDHFAEKPVGLADAARKSALPCIVTVRHPQEGGAGELTPAAREVLFRAFLPLAAYIDVEVRSLARLGGLLAEARAMAVKVIVSDHHFRQIPSERVLRERMQLAQAARADVIKVAAQTDEPAHVARLLGLFAHAAGTPLSVMGMGALGKASRLLFARTGSVLNYGYLGEPQVSGQWEAGMLKRRIAEVWNDK